jgi:hypothetical protein
LSLVYDDVKIAGNPKSWEAFTALLLVPNPLPFNIFSVLMFPLPAQCAGLSYVFAVSCFSSLFIIRMYCKYHTVQREENKYLNQKISFLILIQPFPTEKPSANHTISWNLSFLHL